MDVLLSTQFLCLTNDCLMIPTAKAGLNYSVTILHACHMLLDSLRETQCTCCQYDCNNYLSVFACLFSNISHIFSGFVKTQLTKTNITYKSWLLQPIIILKLMQ